MPISLEMDDTVMRTLAHKFIYVIYKKKLNLNKSKPPYKGLHRLHWCTKSVKCNNIYINNKKKHQLYKYKIIPILKKKNFYTNSILKKRGTKKFIVLKKNIKLRKLILKNESYYNIIKESNYQYNDVFFRRTSRRVHWSWNDAEF